jgi:uncharacterized protein (DUF2164 family)
MRKKMDINKEKRIELRDKIKAYFQNERDEEIGDLAASLILDFVIEELAPEFYNQGIFDAYKYFSDRTEDILGLQR